MTIDTAAFQTQLTKRTSGSIHRPQWRRAFRALITLLKDPQRTEKAFEIFDALEPNRSEHRLRTLLRYAEGRRLYHQHPSLLSALKDRERLRQMPPGSFGHAYARHMDKHGLDAEKLVAFRHESESFEVNTDPGIRWLGDRQTLAHDLSHVLTGYGADDPGEAALLAFSLAQTGGAANLILTLGATVRMVQMGGISYALEMWRAWRRGRRAVPLDAVPYEQLLGEPLSSVRAALKIGEPEPLHRDPAIYASNFR